MFGKFKLNCDEATTICNKNQYGEATIWEKMRLMVHFIHCKVCSLYTRQNNFLTTLYKGYSHQCKNIKHTLDQTQKEDLKSKLRNYKA
ncbi:MAG: hypothetical protein CMB99_10070 [Flavobacteriaceae bacterium]|nr:hypothetical protein [Flavobacteriaceae bacterium]